MRYLLITLMIVLLPLRAWAGNAMAVDMAAQQLVMAQAVTTLPATGMPDDCSMTERSVANVEQAQPASDAAHCSVCDTCELCLPLASVTWALRIAASLLPAGTPAASGIAFVSADRALGFKPPIS